MHIKSDTEIYGIIGHPIKHSISPIVHNAAFEDLKMNCIYESFDVLPENIDNAILGIKSLNIKGINVTIPFKEAVIPLLDYLSDNSKRIGAVNTIKNNNGHLEGYNTDASGFTISLLEQGIQIKDKDIVIIGAGGAARAIVFALATNGAHSILIANRTKERAKNLCDYANKNYNFKCSYCTINEVYNIENIDILINATNVGMYPRIDLSPVDEIIICKAKFVYDLIYNPRKTLFLKYAQSYGIKNSNGLSMLINQANCSFKIWTGKNFNKKLVNDMINKKEFAK